MVEDDAVTEGSSSTAFIVTKAGTLVTRPLSTALHARHHPQAVLRLRMKPASPWRSACSAESEAKDAVEAFYTSASAFVMPVVAIDGHPVGEGRPGPHTRRLRELYLALARA